MRALVVGAGGISRQHLACLQRIPRVSETYVCDLSTATARAMADRFRLNGWTADYEDALRTVKPDVVHVTTPPLSHFDIARRALDSGCHVIVEKPATAKPGQLLELLATAEHRGLVLVEDYNYVFNRPVQTALARLSAGGYGDLVHVDVELSLDIFSAGSSYLDPATNRSFTQMKGGPIADFLPHLASLASAFIGKHSKVHTSWTKARANHPFAVDEFRALVQGATATATLSFSSRAKPDLFALRVEGTTMRSLINVFEGRATHERQLGTTARPLIPLVNGLRESVDVGFGSVRALLGKLSGGPGAYDGLWTLVERTYDALAARSAPPVTAAHMVEVTALVRALTEVDAQA